MTRSHQDPSPTRSAQYKQAPFNSHASTSHIGDASFNSA